jgi:prepilin-type N-terminal cleavage/methylation domain-containing protein
MLKIGSPTNGRRSGVRGFTLVELMVALAISGVTMLVAATLITTLYGRYFQVYNRASAMESLMGAAYNLRQMLGLAVAIQTSTAGFEGGGSFVVPAAAGSIGYLLEKDTVPPPPNTTVGSYFDHITDCSGGIGNVRTVALFARDVGGQGGNGVGAAPIQATSTLMPTGIFYMCPTLTTSGVLFIDPGTVTPGTSTASLGPSYSKLYFDRLVQLDINNYVTAPVTGTLTSVQISITARSFYGTPTPQQMTWCPAADISAGSNGCTATYIQSMTAFRDTTETFQVTFSNQSLKVNPMAPTDTTGLNSAFQRVTGNIRFFPYALPW